MSGRKSPGSETRPRLACSTARASACSPQWTVDPVAHGHQGLVCKAQNHFSSEVGSKRSASSRKPSVSPCALFDCPVVEFRVGEIGRAVEWSNPLVGLAATRRAVCLSAPHQCFERTSHSFRLERLTEDLSDQRPGRGSAVPN